MSLTLRKKGRTWFARGSVRRPDGEKVTVKERTTGCGVEEDARRWVAALENEIRFRPAQHPTFGEAVAEYVSAGKQARYLDRLLLAFESVPIDALTPERVNVEARRYYPYAKESTLRRQWHGPLNAVLNHHARTCASSGSAGRQLFEFRPS